MSDFTLQQIENWRRYEEVRDEGRYNMFDPRARQLTGLSREDYLFTLSNYSELCKQEEESE
jgi:hypothetical protein